MARLNDPPKRIGYEASPSATRASSPPPSNEDAEAAAQQLFTETESRSPVANVPPPSAVLGANLLNAARIEHRNSSPPVDMACKARGKLKRVTMVPDGPRQNLARRGDVYDIELSPEKGRYALPEKVNHKKLKPIASSDAPVLEASGRQSVEVLAQVGVGDDNEERPLPPSPSQAAFAGTDDHVNEAVEETGRPEDVEIEETLADGKPRCIAVAYKYDKRTGPRYQQCKKGGCYATETGTRCSIHHDKHPAVRCGDITVIEGTTTQCHRIATVETINGARCPTHENQHAIQPPKSPVQEEEAPTSAQPTSKRKLVSETGSDMPQNPRRHLEQSLGSSDPIKRNQRQVQIPVRKSKKQRTDKEPIDVQDTANTEIGERSELEPAKKRGKPRKQASSGSTKSSDQVPGGAQSADSNREESVQATNTVGEVASDDAYVEDASQHAESDSEEREKAPRIVSEHTGDIETIFKFLDIEERAGKCQTKLARVIRRTCYRGAPKKEDDMSMDEVMESVDTVQSQLRLVHSELEEVDRPAFKADAYSHVFHHLTLFLEALYDWLSEKCGTVTESQEALRILLRLMGHILTLKDMITTWNVSVPQRYRGDRLIRDVDSGLITPLRQVVKVYRTRLSQLKDEQRRLEQLEELQRRVQQKAEEERIQMEIREKKLTAWRRWQELHVARMRCEPNPIRRRNLVITPLESIEAAEERDANGFEFERIPVFMPRSHPPHHSGSTRTDNHEWTDEEEAALLEGLEHCAGHRVLEDVFQKYCNPNAGSHPYRGILRDCTVTDITARSARFRAELCNLYQNNGWQIPDWVKSIPVLP
ncbi:hypothetical protein PtrSN002B_006357 [Pyrenophora tritici-repentis]|nr:hypothetical protein A1F94_008933 [Pyrenophora tritici-repentis]KAI0579858.1 hypothetical protein Alg215_05529 [Pyrenophora tritici-repentis]KAI0619647.1 hypothetical protein TUN199_08363 [Pyrenophora tritici-repentis]KAI1530427.1 hypothetical protein PtrSN001A_008165 [Pyrenophora tritici-repentis]KAI1532011.1 hypothetical protein PtrSN001C_008110 [Pyrenophora tritici-repentis]